MIKKLLSGFVLIICLAATTSAQTSLAIKYRPNTMAGNQMGFFLTIQNNSSATVLIKDVKIFYYFTLDNNQKFQLDANGGGLQDHIEPIYHHNRYPQPMATDIIEIDFASGAGSISPGGSSGEFQVWITGGVSTCSNDFSYDRDIPASGPAKYNQNIVLIHKGQHVWGSGAGVGDSTAAVEGGYYSHLSPNGQRVNNVLVWNDDDFRMELTNNSTQPYVVFDFKNISSSVDFSAIEKITIRVLHYEDNVFDGNDIRLTAGEGLKPGAVPVVRKSVFLPPLGGSGNEGYFEFDVTSSIHSLEELNSLQLKINFNTSTIGIVRLNKVYTEIDYIWSGKYPSNAVTLQPDNTGGVDLRYGFAYVSLPHSGGTLELLNARGFDVFLEGCSGPVSSFPVLSPYYSALYTVNSSMVKITRKSGATGVVLKYSN